MALDNSRVFQINGYYYPTFVLFVFYMNPVDGNDIPDIHIDVYDYENKLIPDENND